MKVKRVLCILVILSTIFSTGCWSGNEINALAIVVCIGIDKTEKGYLVSEQVINPKAIASKKSTNESPVVLYQEEGPDLNEIARKITTQSSRKIYNAHLRMVVFGEDVARDGIKDILDYFSRNYQYRADFYFVVAKNLTATKVLSILTSIESIPGIELYNSLKMSSEEWAPTKSTRIIELINSIISEGTNPVLTGIGIMNGKLIPNQTDDLKQSSGISKLTYTGLGVFKKDKLIGWLNEDESKGYNYITGNVRSTSGYAYYGDQVKISFEIVKAKSEMKAFLANGKPEVNVEIAVNYNIGAVEGQFDVSKEENKKILNEITENRIKSICEKALEKVKTEYKTDIFGFGEVIHRKYPKVWGKIKDNWNNEFADMTVNITVKTKLNELGQITKPFFIKEKE